MDAVENLEMSEELIQADVSETEEYEIEISLEDGEFTDMYCSCHMRKLEKFSVHSSEYGESIR